MSTLFKIEKAKLILVMTDLLKFAVLKSDPHLFLNFFIFSLVTKLFLKLSEFPKIKLFNVSILF